jgi:methionine aminopeptidase
MLVMSHHPREAHLSHPWISPKNQDISIVHPDRPPGIGRPADIASAKRRTARPRNTAERQALSASAVSAQTRTISSRDRPSAAVPGARVGDISAAIGAAGRAAGYGICTDFGGHGVGRAMHGDPHIPNEGPPGRAQRLVPGLVIAIEPWFLAGGKDVYQVDDDGWTIRSGDGTRAAHAEHTVAATDDGPRVLTVP